MFKESRRKMNDLSKNVNQAIVSIKKDRKEPVRNKEYNNWNKEYIRKNQQQIRGSRESNNQFGGQGSRKHPSKIKSF